MNSDEGRGPWVIREAEGWPPAGRPKAPFSPTTLEVMRSCVLRACFERSSGYERRMSFDGRIGTAFHRTLDSLTKDPPQVASAADIGTVARQRLMDELAAQEAEATQRPRERGLPRDEARIGRAIEAVIVAAQRLFAAGLVSPPGVAAFGPGVAAAAWKGVDSEAMPGGEVVPAVESEVQVASSNRLFRGVVDRVEHVSEGTRLIDFKSSLREDLPERYARQVQLYALMWRDTRDEWPAEAEVVYPLTGQAFGVPVRPETCEQVAREAGWLVARMARTQSADELAKPGDVCKVCEFRPWCRPFWAWQGEAKGVKEAVERAYLGFEGRIESLELVDRFWRVQIAWRQAIVELVAPEERFPQLRLAEVGMLVRVLEARLGGMYFRPRAAVDERTEVFLIESGA